MLWIFIFEWWIVRDTETEPEKAEVGILIKYSRLEMNFNEATKYTDME